MKIYVIVRGKRDYFQVCAATTNKEQAQCLKRAFQGWGGADIEEFEDMAGKEIWLPFLYLTKSGFGGELCEVTSSDLDKELGELKFDKNGKAIGALVYASDPDSAKEKAREMITKYNTEQAKL